MYSILSLIFFLSLTLGSPISNLFNLAVVIFGDSYSDIGNVYRLTDHTWPIVPPYYKGRFCNGPIWVDGLTVPGKFDYAYGSATTDNTLVKGYTKLNTVLVPGVLQQAESYTKDTLGNRFIISLPVYAIWAGGNDLLDNSSITIPQIVDSLLGTVKYLLSFGAKKFVIFNQAPIQAFPAISVLNQPAVFAALTLEANSYLQTSLQQLKQANSGASFYIFDLNTLITNILAGNSSPKFTNTVDPCWIDINVNTVEQLCSDPNTYVFVDSLHFSSAVQQLIADAINSCFSPSFQENAPGCYVHSV